MVDETTPPEPMRVLVTGCAGFIGSHLCEALLAIPACSVVGVDAFTPYYDPRLKWENVGTLSERSSFLLINGDLRDTATLRRIDKEAPFTHVVHLAAEVGVRDSLRRPADYASNNVHGTSLVLERMVAQLQKEPVHCVLASSSSVYGASPQLPHREDDACIAPLSPYAASKRAMELMAYSISQASGLKTTVLRLFTVYGPRQRPEMAIPGFARRIVRKEPIALFDPSSNRRDYTYIDDIVHGILLAMSRPSLSAPPAASENFRIYNIGSGESVPLRHMVRHIEEALGERALVTEVGRASGDMEHTWADLNRAHDELGYRPAVALGDGLKRSAVWLQQFALGL